MDRKPLTRDGARLLVMASFAIFAAAEIFSAVAESWLIHNQSLSNYLTYTRYLTSIPGRMSTGAAIMLALGLARFSRRLSLLAIASGAVLATVSTIMGYYAYFSAVIQYYKGYTINISSGPLTHSTYLALH